MQNEFEKQVQQKMEELKLVPSDPVWEKVEMRIRKKKDRRRVIFWFPLFALVGAGLWIGIDQYSNRIAYSKKDNKTIQQRTIDKLEAGKVIDEKNHQTVTYKKEFQHPADLKIILDSLQKKQFIRCKKTRQETTGMKI